MSGWGIFIRVVAVLVLILLLNRLVSPYLIGLEDLLSPENAVAFQRGLVLTCVLYALLLAVPFVPGVEIGVGLLTMFGANAAPHVYFATLGGLTLAYSVGRLVPLRLQARIALSLRMRRTAALILSLEHLPHAARVAAIMDHAPTRWIPFLLRHRLIAMAVLLNTPGNAIIGGGGGIALVAGISRLISPLAFVAVAGLAVAPVPILVALFGAETVLSSRN
ncbi:MAG: hypothetical protein AAGE38_18925 [Pseudomonadota bacterium]